MSPGVAVRLAGGARFTSRVVDAVWLIVPLVPVTVSDNAQGIVLVVVFIVRVEEPEPLMLAGLKPPLVMPAREPAFAADTQVDRTGKAA